VTIARCRSRLHQFLLVGGALALAAVAPAPPTADDGPEPVRYARDIRRLLSDRCFQCHGPDPKTRHADLRLDVRDAAIATRKGGAAIVPGSPDESELVRRIESHDADQVMPPKTANKRPLSDQEKDLLRRWIAEGAPYEPHWSFVAPTKPAVPTVRDERWCENDIDRFVLASLERAKVQPSPTADKATLARRVYLDLTGLPPTPEELHAFLADASESAYETLVDRLLTEEPYGSRVAERLAAPWLDGARYADTCGIHMDAGRQIWPYRDWVLRAFRDNLPFDRFLVEQLAGDLLPNPTTENLVASGFNRLHVTTDEGGAIAEEYLVEYAVDRVSTTSSVFLGLTAGCARCHDHKFDPISMEDFYGLYAFFSSIDEPGLYSQLPDPNRAPEPFIDVPTPEHAAEIAALTAKIDAITEAMNSALPGEGEGFTTFRTETLARAGATWSRPQVLGATSSFDKVTLTPREDGSVQASGPIPDAEDYVVLLKTDRRDQRLLLLEALATPPEAGGTSRGAGRMPHGNAVLTSITLETRPAGSNAEWERVPFRWAWADVTQTDRDFAPVYLLDGMQPLGWAADGNDKAGERLLAFLADKPFGGNAESPETELRVTLAFRSPFAQHSMGRVRFHVGAIGDEGLAMLPTAPSRWQHVGPFPAESATVAYERQNGPETVTSIDLAQNFGAGNQFWRFDPRFADETTAPLADGLNASYLGRMIWSPTDRELDVALGTDDGFHLFVNGTQVAAQQVNRSITPGQDRVRIPLKAGKNSLVLKVVNTGGPAAYWYGQTPSAVVLDRDLLFTLLPTDALGAAREDRLASAWRRTYFPAFRDAEAQRAALVAERTAVEAKQPRTMVMRELPEQRPTFVLTRGQYDHPDRSRPVSRAIPKAFGSLPQGAPANRLGLAQWMIAAENPLVARVAVNRLWEIAFGAGLVRTSEDFGQQGEWPTHPELLDWLAVDFREHQWDMRRMLRMIVTSATYRQSSVVRADLDERDPENRLLAYYPRRRLGAEQIRDQALYVAGILVEKLGGPSVKPYQPAGLWQEVSMPQSNTRVFEQGMGDDLWRRSIYTYWKRACPPPSLQTFDAPTREACVIRRPSTNTPLQALVLWNDVQYVEAARSLAERTLLASGADDTARMRELFLRCTGREAEAAELERLLAAIASFRARYATDPDAASALVRTGNRPVAADIPPVDLAAWTMVASAVMNLHETITQD
jgi:mono/diheme cytochrome c family protein